MSYILDALKKSEQQRPPGPVPDLFTVHGPQPPAPRRPARAIVVVALLLVVTALVLWGWFGTGGRDEAALRPPAAASSLLRAEAPVAPATPRTAAPPAAPAALVAPAAPDHAAAVPGPVQERRQAPAASAQKSNGSVASSVVPGKAPTVAPAPEIPPASAVQVPVFIPQAPDSLPVAPNSNPQASDAMPAAPAMSPPADMLPQPQPEAKAETPTATVPAIPPAESGSPAAPPVAAAEPVPVAPAPEEMPPADGRVLDLAELPAPIRASLPKLLVSGHVWSEDPALRLLSVDDQLLREGGEAAPGVKLQEITPSGAVFVYKGWHFRVAGGRP